MAPNQRQLAIVVSDWEPYLGSLFSHYDLWVVIFCLVCVAPDGAVSVVLFCYFVFSVQFSLLKWWTLTTLHLGPHFLLLTTAFTPSGHSTIKAWLVECCRGGCPSGRFFHLHRGTLELCQSDHWVLGHLPDQGPSPPIAQFGQAASPRKSLGGHKLLPFKNEGVLCVIGDLQCCIQFLVPFPRSVPRYNPVSELYGQILQPHGLIFALTCTVNCAYPNRILLCN